MTINAFKQNKKGQSPFLVSKLGPGHLPALFLLIYLTTHQMPWVRGAKIQREYNQEPNEPGRLSKLLTQGMSNGDEVEGTNSTYNTNLFFWFFPAAYNQDDAPLVLWLNGAASSSMFGLFVETGPFSVDGKGYLNARPLSWTLTHSILYIDSPAGVGFSFTDDEDGYAVTPEDIARDLYVFLTQFFLIFPKFRSNDFFLIGQSYAAKYLPALGVKIHTENEKVPAVSINLKGVLLFCPYVEPLIQANVGPFLQSVGLIDDRQKISFDQVYEMFTKFIETEDWHAAHELMDESLYGDLTPYATLYFNATGFRNYLNYMRPVYPPTYSYHRAFLRTKYVRSAIHVGTQKFHSFSRKVMRGLRRQFHRSGRAPIEFLLDAGYNILMVAGQLDVGVHANGVNRMVHDLNWPGKEDFADSERSRWMVNNDIAGYIKTARNLAFVVMRNAGHTMPHDKPLWAFTLANEFTSGLLLDDRVVPHRKKDKDDKGDSKNRDKDEGITGEQKWKNAHTHDHGKKKKPGEIEGEVKEQGQEVGQGKENEPDKAEDKEAGQKNDKVREDIDKDKEAKEGVENVQGTTTPDPDDLPGLTTISTNSDEPAPPSNEEVLGPQ